MEPISAYCAKCEQLTYHTDDFKGEKCLDCGAYKQEWSLTQKADKFLTLHNLEFRAVLVGDDCPGFCDDSAKDHEMDKVNTFPRRSHIHGKHYRCTISGAGRGHVSFDFWNSYADEEFRALGTKAYRKRETYLKYTERKGGKLVKLAPKTVEPYDLLACLTKYDPGTFEWFCSDFGYDTDSRRAHGVFEAVVKEYHKVSKFFTPEEMTELEEIS